MRRFRSLGALAAESGKNVSGNRRNLEADEDQQQLDGAGHQEHAGCAEAGQREVFARDRWWSRWLSRER